MRLNTEIKVFEDWTGEGDPVWTGTFEEFLSANADDMSDADVAAIQRDCDAFGYYNGGGGAAADASADAYASAYAERAKIRDKVLSDYAEDVVQILVEMKVPGVQWLALTEAVAA